MQLSYDCAKDHALMCLRANYESHLRFRMIENMRARTSSGSVDARVFYFLYSVMVFNLWVVANVILTQGARWDGKSVLSQGQFGENILETMRSNPPGPEPPLVEAKRVHLR